MTRRCMILLAVAMTIGALPSSANAQTVQRLSPIEASFSVPRGVGLPFVARFSGLMWPYGWHEAEWYVDGVRQYTQTIGGQTAETTFHWGFDTPGTVQIKVRGKYDSFPFGVDVWTDYLTWTVDVYAHPPVASRVSPDSPVTVQQGDTQAFSASATDPLGKGVIERVAWYLNGMHQADFEFDPLDPAPIREHTWSYKFDTAGIYRVEAVFCEHYDCSGSGEAVWTVEVEPHTPSATIMSPSSPCTTYAGIPVTFTVMGTDPADDLYFSRVYLDGVFQTDAYFTCPVSGCTAAWTHTFNTPGTYGVEFVPVDLADNYGLGQEWTVGVEANPEQAGLTGLVIELDAQGRAKGPLAGATLDLTGPAAGTATTDGQGQFAFTGLEPGTYTANVSKTGFYAQSRNVSLAAGETKDEVFRLTPESLEPSAFDFTSPGGKYFIEGMPGDLSFSVIVAWNGSPGSVRFNVAGTWHAATVIDLGAGMAQASLTIPAPATISACSELKVEVANGEGKRTSVDTGVYLHPLPPIIPKWYPDTLAWVPLGSTLYYKDEASFTLLEAKIGSACSIKAATGLQRQLSFAPRAGTFSGSIGGFGELSMNLDVSKVELLGEGRMDRSGTLAIELAGCDSPTVTPGWTLSLSGKAGVGAPAVLVVSAVFPPAAPAIDTLLTVPVVKDIVGGLKLRLYLIGGGALSGEYAPGETGTCLLGATSISGSLTLGLEGQVVLGLWGAEAGVYAGGTGTPEFQMCPTVQFRGVTVRAYVGVFASAWFFRFSREVGVTVQFKPSGQAEVLAVASIPQSYPGGDWQPIGDSCLRWGETNLLAGEDSPGSLLRSLSVQGEISQETILVENVVPLANPAILAGSSERLILFCLQDPNKPWFAATDIGTLHQADDQPWVLDRIVDDQAGEFSPSIVAVDSGMSLAAWERVSGDVSDANEPGQIAPHLEIVAAWFEPSTGLWSTPEQLTSNAVVDHQPMPIALGETCGILWIANEGSAAVGDANSGDRLMFTKWAVSEWDEPQTLWSAQKGILGFAFAADGSGEGHVVLAVDEDGDPNTKADCELYLLSTANGTWQTAIQLTTDLVEDAMPALVAPNGVPMCAWSAGGTLLYSQVHDWNPRQVYSEYTLANEAPSLDAVTMPGGAAIAYTVQSPNGVNIVASFYDADLDCWSLPRQLTVDEHAETALSLTCDANELVIAYLKTQTLRDDVDVEIDGQVHRLENIPQPGRTDLYVMRHTLANDLAVVSESMVVEPANPAPGTVAAISATIENRGDLPLQDVEAVFYDGDPSNGGVTVGDRQVISGTLIAGGKENVSVSWDVPLSETSHEIFVVVDPCLAVEDRDRSNNGLSVRTALPDLAVETCWSTEVSSTAMALTARVVNTGVIAADAFDVSWRLGAAGGEEIGRSTIDSLIAGGAYEATFIWDSDGHLDPGQHAQVFAVADAAGGVPEFDETNNVHSLSVLRSPVCPVGDLNADCRVHMSDFGVLASWWAETGCAEPGWCGGADLNQDAKVSLADVAILTSHWLEDNGP
ncbi:MAG: carboxypeptidase regulatory-like domain-containing protein [Phycisphaerales bacterium]|nr:MAG: carboxypeptidase regulatory-like domain-containing protein [Phycisphaerales bacterium]